MGWILGPNLLCDVVFELLCSPEHYHLLDHNCNNFTAEAALFLTGNSIPDYITNLPDEVMST